MRILVAGTYGERNGIETYTRHLVAGLSDAGHDVFLADRSAEGVTAPGAESIRLPPRNWPVWRLLGPFEATRAHAPLRAAVERVRPDIVHLTYPEFVVRSAAPLVVTAWHLETRVARRARSARERGERPRSSALHAMSDRRALRRAAGVIATSPGVGRAVTGGPATLVEIPPFLPDSAVRSGPGSRSRDCIMVAGALDDPRKGLPLAIEAVEALRATGESARLVLVGGWRAPDAAPRLPGFCEPRGLLPAGDVASVLRGAGCLVVPSVFEEFGYAALEALAAGTPVASTRLPGFEGITTDGLVTASARRVPEFADAIARALDIRTFIFPDACRASVAVERIERLYHAVSR